MKVSYAEMINRLNNRLQECNQITRVISYSGNSVSLTSGVTLNGNNKVRFCKRVLNTKTNIWAINTDNLLSGAITVREIKSALSAIGGIKVQELYGERIRKNLNTGMAWNSGTRGQNIGTRGPLPQCVKDAISKKNSGKGNGMYGVKMTDSDKQRLSEIMKQKILDGKFTPNSNNRNTHWDAMFDGKQYRSSWEALYQYINQQAEYETFRMEYVLDKNIKVYIVDFIDHKNKIVVEVKPKELCCGKKFEAKYAALSKWATIAGYNVLLVDKLWLKNQTLENIDYSRFDNKTASKIKALYETN